ncbi:MAG: mevalonate kinase [Methanomassiliicoccales archaeon]|nr:MAG: mevalonate kinase [Methanomassiliicoccales archaeon]
MGEGSGYGKVILFNEHFVVYGIPAIASAIGSKTIARVDKTEGTGWTIKDERPETPGYKKNKMDHQNDSIERILKAAGIDVNQTPINIYLGGDLKAASGVGASAASCAAIARALSVQFNLGFSDERVNEIAYEGEKGYHGTPSGIDNTAATFGGLIWFKRGDPSFIKRLALKQPVEIVMGNTGVVANTKAAVAGVKERKENEPEKYDKIFDEAKELAQKARSALEVHDLQTVGQLMNKNHELLQQIEVSSQDLDFLVKLARDNGAHGAKMTGGGLGGYMVALTPGKEVQEKVAQAMEKEGFEALITKIGV